MPHQVDLLPAARGAKPPIGVTKRGRGTSAQLAMHPVHAFPLQKLGFCGRGSETKDFIADGAIESGAGCGSILTAVSSARATPTA